MVQKIRKARAIMDKVDEGEHKELIVGITQ